MRLCPSVGPLVRHARVENACLMPQMLLCVEGGLDGVWNETGGWMPPYWDPASLVIRGVLDVASGAAAATPVGHKYMQMQVRKIKSKTRIFHI